MNELWADLPLKDTGQTPAGKTPEAIPFLLAGKTNNRRLRGAFLGRWPVLGARLPRAVRLYTTGAGMGMSWWWFFSHFVQVADHRGGRFRKKASIPSCAS